jgi:hypothetical protein
MIMGTGKKKKFSPAQLDITGAWHYQTDAW